MTSQPLVGRTLVRAALQSRPRRSFIIHRVSEERTRSFTSASANHRSSIGLRMSLLLRSSIRSALILAALPLAAHAAPPTFHAEILPILQRRCQACHRPGEIGPMPFLTYNQVRPWARAIRESVKLRRMPPWFAERASVRFENDPTLTPEEIARIDAWASAGAPPGDPAQAPAPIQWPQGWFLPKVDFTVVMPRAIPIPAREELDYQWMILPLGFTEDRWVTAAEIRPGARDAVHHIVAYIREPGSAWLRDQPAGEAFTHPGVTTSDILALYTPGTGPMLLPAGMAKLVPAGSDLVLQFHYTPTGRSTRDLSTVGLTFVKDPPEKRVLTLQMGTVDFYIPPRAANHRIAVFGTLPGDALLLSLLPHMHLRGKAFDFEIVEPGGRVETLLRVAPFHFYWQLNYRLARPRLLKQGTRLRFTAWYDNSANNPLNPDPDAGITYGERSRDEMMVGFFDVAVDPAFDKPAFFNSRPR
ncbi:MAG: thiol-disulfide isomerase [Bryobacteraceae bacterium]|nr:thiol-disulfide isomerase [Bryobacteraceae bacterium]